MFYILKRLIVVLTLAAIIFHFAKPIVLQFTSADDFSRRRLAWFVLTIVSFLVPSFWLYALVAVPMFLWAGRRDSNPVALYLLMLHVVPPADFNIPILGNNGLFPMNNYRLLAFCILLPTVIRYRKSREKDAVGGWGAMDVLLLATGVLEVALYCPPDLPTIIPDSPTNMVRRAFLFALDTYLVYYAVSRCCESRRKMVDAAAAFCLACAVMALVAIFENARHWLLYLEVVGNWGAPLRLVDWLMRNDQLRAMASAGHALSLGFLLAVGFGFWLFLKSHLQSRIQRVGVTLLLWGGLFAAYSRGPWLGAVTVYFAFFATGPRALSRVAKSAIFAGGFALLLMLSPVGDRVFSVLPFMGHTVDANILYRQHLADRGWHIVMEHPFFGNQFPYPEMEDLRQGEGIIDIVNTYLGVALNSGLIGLFCFSGFILIAVTRVFARTRALAHSDPDLVLFGTSLIACIVGTLVMIQSASFIMGAQKMFYVLAGLATAYVKVAVDRRKVAVEPRRKQPASRALHASRN
jgi:O-antigen ligase